MFMPNPLPDYGRPLDPTDRALLGRDGTKRITAFLSALGKTDPTPLHTLPALAQKLGIGELYVKDESGRLGLGSFKALGGAYAVASLACDEAAAALGRTIGFEDLAGDDVRAITMRLTFCCATDGNHGRSVAMGAQLIGARSTIFIHEGVSAARADAIAAFGARIVRVAGTYDDSVDEAARHGSREDWLLVSDTTRPGYEHVPGLVMQGYTAMIGEALASLAAPPTHVFLQAGVGGMAAAVAAHLHDVCGSSKPMLIVVEPARAACILESVRAGIPKRIDHDQTTLMAMLECYEPSLIAWRILTRLADSFMTVDEADAVVAMRELFRPAGDDPAIVAGESGGAGLAGLMVIALDPAGREAIALGGGSRILLINTEGATDPASFTRLVM